MINSLRPFPGKKIIQKCISVAEIFLYFPRFHTCWQINDNIINILKYNLISSLFFISPDPHTENINKRKNLVWQGKTFRKEIDDSLMTSFFVYVLVERRRKIDEKELKRCKVPRMKDTRIKIRIFGVSRTFGRFSQLYLFKSKIPFPRVSWTFFRLHPSIS